MSTEEKKSRTKRVLDRQLFIGWPPESDFVRRYKDVKMNIAFYEAMGQIPADEPAPDFLRINGETIKDSEIESLLIVRGWKPTFLRVVGRWNSPFQTFGTVRSPWVMPGLIALIPILIGITYLLLSRLHG